MAYVTVSPPALLGARKIRARHSHRPSSEGTFHVDTPRKPLIDRRIEA